METYIWKLKTERKMKMPKMYKSHPAYGAHVVELPSGKTIWNVVPFVVYET